MVLLVTLKLFSLIKMIRRTLPGGKSSSELYKNTSTGQPREMSLLITLHIAKLV